MENYNEEDFWTKVKNFAKKAGVNVIYAGLLLYNVLEKPEISAKDKAIILAALGYFISPIDAIPDMLPGGFVDDLGALVLALGNVSSSIDEDIKLKAKDRLGKWFSSFEEKDLEAVERFL